LEELRKTTNISSHDNRPAGQESNSRSPRYEVRTEGRYWMEEQE